MPIVLEQYSIAYYPVPKVASTSLKLALYELAHHSPFIDYTGENGELHHIHNSWFPLEPTLFSVAPNAGALFKFTIVRDPIDRFLSAYSNRVHYHRELSPAIVFGSARARDLQLAPDPDLNTFIARLADYSSISPHIHHHVQPQTDFIGTDMCYFDLVEVFPDLTILIQELKQRTGRSISLPTEQQSLQRFDRAALSSQQIETLKSYYRSDYRAFGHLLKERPAEESSASD